MNTKILRSEISEGNVIEAINIWAVPIIHYTAGIIDWTQMELDNLDQKTRKLMIMHQPFYTQKVTLIGCIYQGLGWKRASAG